MMKILQLTRKFPYPPIDGESLNLSNFNSVLKEEGYSVDLLSFNTVKHYFKVEELPPKANYYRKIYDVYLDNRIKALDAGLNLFSSLPFHVTRYITQEFKTKLLKVLGENKYDLILIESINLMPYHEIIKENSDAKIVYRAHNVEYEIWERITQNESNIVKKAYLSYLTRKLKRYELDKINQFDTILTVTQRDLKRYQDNGFKGKGIVVPAGIRGENYTPSTLNNSNPVKISFIGSLDWIPNIEGLEWFFSKVWKTYIAECSSNAELHIAGRNIDKSVFQMESKNVVIHGEVPDAKAFLNSFDIMIVPLLSGGGMRLKILEGLALGRIVITTSLGLEGIDAIDGEEVLIADSAEEFIEKLQFCENNTDKMLEMSRKAVALFKNKFDSSTIVQNFIREVV